MNLRIGTEQKLSRALALDGHGVVYSRKLEVVDALMDALHAHGWLFIPRSDAKSLYLSLQERTFAREISYEEMLAEFSRGLDLPAPDAVAQLHSWVQKLSADIVIDPDLESALAEIRARGVTVGMLTNSIHSDAVKQHWLKQAGISHLFDFIVSSVDAQCRKPDPEIFRRFATQVGLPPEAIAFVGHDPVEIKGAKAAGMTTICLRCSCRQADYAVRRFSEVAELPLWPPPLAKEG